MTQTVSDLARRYELHLRSYRGASPRTCESYGATYARFLKHLANTGLGDDVRNLTPEVCQAYAQARISTGLSPNGVQPELSALVSLARFGNLPWGWFERPKRRPVSRPFLAPAGLKSFVQGPKQPREQALSDLILATTLRASELARLDVADVFEDAAGRVCLWVTVKGRAGERRAIPLPAEVGVRLLADVRARRAQPGDPLLVNSVGGRYTRDALSHTLGRIGRRVGIACPTRAHSFRHSLNALARTAGLDVVQRAALLNHADQRTLQHYDHLQPEETAAARDTLWQAVQEATR